MIKTPLALLVIGLLLAACTKSVPASSKASVLSQSLASSAQIFVEREGGVRRAGSAVVLATELKEGQAALLTTAHLLEPPVEQSAYLAAVPSGERIPVEIVAVDSNRDLAFLTAPLHAVSQGNHASQVELAESAELADEILIVAYPWGRQRTVVKGAVSQIAVPASATTPFPIRGPVGLVDATVSYGMSGGGVFGKQDGKLVGLVRGYRTAHLSLSSDQSPLKVPIAGETTVISTQDIMCFLRAIDQQALVGEELVSRVGELDCEQKP